MNVKSFLITFLIVNHAVNNPSFAQPPRLVLPIGHHGTVTDIQYSPDGRIILTLAPDQTAKVWDAKTGLLLYTISGYKNEIVSAVISPDSRMIATASGPDHLLRLWDLVSGKLLRTLQYPSIPGHDSFTDVCYIRFSPSGETLLSCAYDDSYRLWDVRSGKLLFTHQLLKGHGVEGEEGFTYPGSAFCPDGKSILLYSSLHLPEIWDAQNGFKLFAPGENLYFNQAAAFSADNKWLVADAVSFTDAREQHTHQSDYSVIIWDLGNHKIARHFNVKTIMGLQFSPDSKKLFLVSFSELVVYDTNKWNKLAGFPDAHISNLMDYHIFPDSTSSRVFLGSPLNSIYSSETGEEIFRPDIPEEETFKVIFSPDWKRFVRLNMNGELEIHNTENGNLLYSLNTKVSIPSVHSVVISPADTWLLAITNDGDVHVWETMTGRLVNTFRAYDSFSVSPEDQQALPDPENKLRYTQFSPDEKLIITYENQDSAGVWEIATGKLLARITKEHGSFRVKESGAVSLLQGGKQLILKTGTGHTVLKAADYDLAPVPIPPDEQYHDVGSILKTHGRRLIQSWKGVELKDLQFDYCPEGQCNAPYLGEVYVAFSHHANWVATVSGDNLIHIRDRNTARLLYSLYQLGSEEYMVRLSSGYYSSTTGAARQLYYVSDKLQVINFDQLDVKYNRPDVVLQALGSKNGQLIKSFQAAWYKRVKRLGIDTMSLKDGIHIPESDIVNREAIFHELNQDTVSIHIKGSAVKSKLTRFNIWINETPYYGKQGHLIAASGIKQIDTAITITLTPGMNRIESSVIALDGMESYRLPLFINCTVPPDSFKQFVYFAGIGIDQFADSVHNLQYSVKDIRDLSAKMKALYGDKLVLDTLFNEQVTPKNVIALKQKLALTGVNDKIIVAYSGHGLLSSDLDYYLSTYSVNFSKPEENGLPYEELEDLLDSIPARKKLMLIDACHSGEVDKESFARKFQKPSKPGNAEAGSKGGESRNLRPIAAGPGLQNSFDLMQELFVNVGKSTGATIISAAAGTESALEYNDLKNGVFTYSLLEALEKDPSLKISSLRKVVGARVSELTKGKQKPTSRNEPVAADWSL